MNDTVAILVNNTCDFDSRVLKGAFSIAKSGLDVVVLARAGEGLPAFEERQGVRMRRIAWFGPKEVLKSTINRWVGGAKSAISVLQHPERHRPGTQQADESKLSEIPRLFKPLKRLLGRHVREPLIHYEHASACLATLIALAPKICHAHDLDTLMTALLAKRVLGPENLRVIYDSHEIACEEYGNMPYAARAWRKYQERRCMKDVDAIIAAWPGISDYFDAHYGRRADAVILNTPCVDAPTSAPSILSSINLSASERLVVFIGTVRHDRGVFRLLEALSLVDNWRLAFVGPSKPKIEYEIQNRAIELNVSDRIHLMGAVHFDQVIHAVGCADASVLLNENSSMNFDCALPNKLFESVLAGVPVVVGDLSASRQFVMDLNVGYVVDQQDPGSIAAALERINADPGAMRLSRKRLAALRAEFGWQAQAEKLLGVYNDLRSRCRP